ncbi:hypothetical protein BH23CHL7_BH23CHL7_10480 [soil metagenome]
MPTIEAVIRPSIERGECEHMAALLDSIEDLPPLVASFFKLGATRNGWLVHGSLPGAAADDRAKLAAEGLEVDDLENRDQLAVLELDLSVQPEEWVKPWSARLDERLRAGFDALWFARFPIGTEESELSDVLPFEAAWMSCFDGRPVVTLCPYIVAGLDEQQLGERRRRVSAVHDRIIDDFSALSTGGPGAGD